MKLLYSFAALAVSVTALDDTELPNPPVCVNDCPLFDLVATGTVDDCMVLSQWSASGCLSDCGLSDHAVLLRISNQFCRRLDAADGSYGGSYGAEGTTDATPAPTPAPYGGSYGGSYGAEGTTDATPAPTPAPTASPTVSPTIYQCQDSLYDQTNICASIAPTAAVAGGCANLLGVEFPGAGPVTEDDLVLFAAMCPGTCSDLYTSSETGLPACQCMPYYYTCLDSETPPCQNNPMFVDENGEDMCAMYEALMAENGITADKCDSFANLAVAEGGGDYGDYVATLSGLGTYCPILCDSCDGFAVTKEEDWTPESPCARLCVEAGPCFANGVFQDWCPPEAAGCAPCFPAVPTQEPTAYPIDEEEPTAYPTSYPTDLCGACTDTCDDGPENCATMEQLVAVGGCANSCLDTQEALDACIKPTYDKLQCTADDFVLAVNEDLGDLVVTLNMQMTFADELDTDGVATASGAIEATVAEESGIDEEYVTATMTLADDRRRHLLSISYDVSIIITIPAAAWEGDVTILAAVGTLEELVGSDASLEELTAAITSDDTLKELNGGDEPGVTSLQATSTVGDFPIQPTEEPEPASASVVSPALGLLVSAVCVAASL